MRFTTNLVASVVALTVAGCAIQMPASAPVARSAGPRTASPYTSSESRIFDLINAERSRRGLKALVYNPQLDEMAKIQATNMAHFQKMAHVLPDAQLPTLKDRAQYVGYRYGEIAENVALGYPSAETVVEGWMNSSGHRHNILDAGEIETGIGIARSPSGGLYYAQVFGRRLSYP
jgi:uncharacterized protein YkwD